MATAREAQDYINRAIRDMIDKGAQGRAWRNPYGDGIIDEILSEREQQLPKGPPIEERWREIPPMYLRQLQEYVKSKTGINFCEKPTEPAAFILDPDGTLYMHNDVRRAKKPPAPTWARIGIALSAR